MNLARDLAFRAADVDAAQHLVRRLDLLHADRCAQDTAGDPAAAVRDAQLIHNLVDTATPQQLRAALIMATTPELRSVPVALGPTAQSSHRYELGPGMRCARCQLPIQDPVHPAVSEELEQAYRDSPGFRERGL